MSVRAAVWAIQLLTIRTPLLISRAASSRSAPKAERHEMAMTCAEHATGARGAGVVGSQRPAARAAGRVGARAARAWAHANFPIMPQPRKPMMLTRSAQR